ncbi:MAG: GNAT family N-acetyltransferase [Chloroflexia bacterium]
METQTTFTTGPYRGEADLQAVCDLVNVCNEVDRLEEEPYATPATFGAWLASPDVLDKERDIRVWQDAGGRVVGLGRLRVAEEPEEGKVDTYLYFRVHPDVRDTGLDNEVIEWAGDVARQMGRERKMPAFVRSGLHVSTPEYVAYRQELLEANDFRPVRYMYKMARPLAEPIPEPEFPEGFTLSQGQGEADAEQWVEMFNETFIDSWNFHPMGVEDRKHILESPNYDPELDLIAVAPDSTYVAFSQCGIDPEDNAAYHRNEGWVHVLGTRRGFRKLGLGRSLLLASMRRLKAAGVDTAVLGVDAESPTGALRLYELVGFVKANTSVVYEKDLEEVRKT